MNNSELKRKLAETIELLSINGIGRGRFTRLVNQFGSVRAVLDAKASQLIKIPGISDTTASDIVKSDNSEQSLKTSENIISLGWTVLLQDDKDYPNQLKNIPQADQPPMLFIAGDKDILKDQMIAIVGSRHATEKGKQFAYNLASSLVKAGITVVSGMAEGIDSAAHKGALDAGGNTAAVWGNSLDQIYPPSNKQLAQDIKSKGVVVSEYLPGTKPDRNNFPERNRIISGLSEGVVVVEAGQKSGALLTAGQALLQQRALMAVPGKPSDKMSIGCNNLIKNGARLITSVDDIFEELPRLRGKVVSRQLTLLPEMSSHEKEIVNLCSEGPQQVDFLSRKVNIPVNELMEFLLALELKGVVREISGKRYQLSEDYI